jgi:hypothetical protein
MNEPPSPLPAFIAMGLITIATIATIYLLIK